MVISRCQSLRNVAQTAPCFHSGFLSTLKEVEHFYNKRDVLPSWLAEFPATVNHQEMGNLHLTAKGKRHCGFFEDTVRWV